MLGFLTSQLRHRPGRATALAAAVLVAAVSFVLLTSAAKTSSLRVQGTLKSNYRAAYDILVRPRGSTTPLERQQRLVRPNFLSGVFGGITLKQWQTIEHIRGVEVAAPIANLGYVFPFEGIPVRLNRFLTDAPVQLFRARATWIANGGASRYPAGDAFVYFTRKHTIDRQSDEAINATTALPVERTFYNGVLDQGPFALASTLAVYSAKSPDSASSQWPQSDGFLAPRSVGTAFDLNFPVLVAAVDPVEEARLVHLDRAVVSGRYFRPSESWHLFRTSARTGIRVSPTLASTRTYLDEHLKITVQRLSITRPSDVPRRLASADSRQFLERLRGTVIARQGVSAQQVYSKLIGQPYRGFALTSRFYWTTSAVRYRRVGKVIRPFPVHNRSAVWRTPFTGTGYWSGGAENADTQFRRLFPNVISMGFNAYNVINSPDLRVIGQFDPNRLPGFSPLSRVPLETYYPPEIEPATASARQILHGGPLRPTQNVGDYISQPPLLLTTLQGLKPWLNPKHLANAVGPLSHPTRHWRTTDQRHSRADKGRDGPGCLVAGACSVGRDGDP